MIVIISRGIEKTLIIDKTRPTAIEGTRIMENATHADLNNSNNIKNIAPKTTPNVFICELNRLCKRLL